MGMHGEEVELGVDDCEDGRINDPEAGAEWL